MEENEDRSSNSNEDNVVLIEDDTVEKNKKKAKKRKICETWVKTFGKWLEKKKTLAGNEELFCKVCNSFLKVSSGKSDLIRHTTTKKHKEKSSCLSGGHIPIDMHLKRSTGEVSHVQNLELQLSAFVAEHNLPFSCMDHLSLFLKTSIPDSKIASTFSCGRTKTTAIVKNVLGRTQFEYLCSLLRQEKFSLCIDESTDISNKKSLCLVARVTINCHIKDFFFGLIEVEDSKALSIYKCIVEYFEKNNINYKQNLIGFAADGANAMTGVCHSVASLLKDDVPNLFIMKCVCHSIALCSSNACLMLPSGVESLVRDIYNYISNSPKRNAQLMKILSLLEYKPKKMLHPAQTRWLSLESVVNRVLELYEPLKIYFSFAYNIDKIDSAKTIYCNLNETNELYLCFLKYILHIINNINKMFQSSNSQIQNMYEEMLRLYLKILDNFIDPMYLNANHFHKLDFENKEKFLNYKDVYLGIYFQEKLSNCKLSSSELKEITNNCIQFYVVFCKGIKKRFDFDNSVLKELSFMNPKNIIKKSVSSIRSVIQKFPNLIDPTDAQKIDDEFRELRHLKFSEHFENLNNLSCEEFWSTISKITRGGTEYAFHTLCKFVSNLMSLPSSSANVERIFSKVNMNKNKYRNRLHNPTLEGILFTQDYLLHNNCSCYNLKIDSNVLKNFKPQQYFSKDNQIL